MSVLLAIDPGRVSGWALYGDRILLALGVSDGDRPETFPQVLPDQVVVERPESRGSRGAPADDLIALALRAGLFAGWYRAPITWARVSSWKGSLSKTIVHMRAVERLTAPERNTLAAARPGPDTLDAVAIGLWALGRARFI